jgi:hypothetical protein
MMLRVTRAVGGEQASSFGNGDGDGAESINRRTEGQKDSLDSGCWGMVAVADACGLVRASSRSDQRYALEENEARGCSMRLKLLRACKEMRGRRG